MSNAPTEPTVTGKRSPDSSARLLRGNRDFRLLWTGQTASELGASIAGFAYPLLMLAISGSAFAAGALLTVRTVSTMAVRLIAGVLVDRWNRRTVMVVADAGRFATAGLVALLAALDQLPVSLLFAAAVLDGAFTVFFSPAESAALRQVVAQDQRRTAVALNEVRGQAVGLAGPPLGGLLFGVSRALPFVADAVTYLLSLIAVLLLKTPLHAPPRTTERRRRGLRSLLADISEGLGWLWRWRFVRLVLAWSTVAGSVAVSSNLLIIVLAQRDGASSFQIGVVFLVSGGFGLVSALLTPRLAARVGDGRAMIAAAWVVAVAIGMMAIVPWPLLGLLAGLVAAPAPLVGVVVFGRIAEHVPDELQGRVTSASRQVIVSFMLLTPLALGALLDGVGPASTAVVMALALGLLALVLTLNRTMRHTIDDPPRPPRAGPSTGGRSDV